MNKIVNGIAQAAHLLEGKRFLLVRGGSYDYLDIKSFFDAYPHAEFSGFTPNPQYEQICKGVEAFKENDCDMIVAVGGGSAIDVAKCIKLFSNMDAGENYLTQQPVGSDIPLIAVPTTAGSGSESTKHAVFYYEGEKRSISHESILPDYAVLEPSVLNTLPLYQKKCTMLDALCQAIESWWAVRATDESKRYSKAAIRGIMANWRAYIEDDSEIAAAEIMTAANYAGRAINITATTAAHAMSYKLTSTYGLSHGHAVAICMPEVWLHLIYNADEALMRTLREISSMIELDWFVALINELGMEYPASADRDIAILVSSVNTARLGNLPVVLTSDTLGEMYERIIRCKD